jgi:hypothetical protein
MVGRRHPANGWGQEAAQIKVSLIFQGAGDRGECSGWILKIVNNLSLAIDPDNMAIEPRRGNKKVGYKDDNLSQFGKWPCLVQKRIPRCVEGDPKDVSLSSSHVIGISW